MPQLHIVAGANGVGKTTAFKNLVPEDLDYINADLIAKVLKEQAGGLNTQDLANQEAARVFEEKARLKESFALETNLYDVQTYKSFQALQKEGYEILIYFFAVEDVDICIDRVKLRVEQGGHNVNPDVVRQRYLNGLALLKHYKDFPDLLMLLDNTDGILTTQLELERGAIRYQNPQCRFWALEILSAIPSKDSILEQDSIDEVRKMYRCKKGI